MKPFSLFGQKFTQTSGITELMQDLGEAISKNDPETCMLGGGNPAVIPAVMDTFRQEMQHIIDNKQFDKALGFYSSPQGEKQFINALVDLVNEEYQWGISSKNIMLTNGSQNSFFIYLTCLLVIWQMVQKRKFYFHYHQNT